MGMHATLPTSDLKGILGNNERKSSRLRNLSAEKCHPDTRPFLFLPSCLFLPLCISLSPSLSEPRPVIPIPLLHIQALDRPWMVTVRAAGQMLCFPANGRTVSWVEQQPWALPLTF